MLTISRQQFEALSRTREQGFTARAVAHLRAHHPEWCHGREDAALAARAAAALAFAREHGVSHEANVLRLMDLQLRPGFALPLADYPRYRLTQRGLEESARVANFALALTRPRPLVVISLDTDLDALERGHA
ncbi:hypothetical protein ATI61_10697 [Archangium gephyra]|uniref:Uncharacterized protein n=1 Tax=Archangium gephyra TaxID=48 RepID=A0AAC8Q0D9_9BACT|nr:hypothetical protein [Archangium gephyra]AKI98702.1 Hypothetical protein AA314_00329 [Archangium gephyra]REG30628.1 hypothetical protein ATI61_10697 [Archangium gephyra]